MRANKTIKVVPNPYSALDADGRAQGVVSKEGHLNQYVGAWPDIEESGRTGKNIFSFVLDPVVLPATAYYMRRLQERAILPADAETAKFAGFNPEKFESPESVLAKERARAEESFESENGFPPAFAESPPHETA